MAISTAALTSVSKNIPWSPHSYALGEPTVPSELISISLPYNPCCNFKSMNPVEPVFWAWNNPKCLIIFHHLQDLQYCSWKKLQEGSSLSFHLVLLLVMPFGLFSMLKRSNYWKRCHGIRVVIRSYSTCRLRAETDNFFCSVTLICKIFHAQRIKLMFLKDFWFKKT